MAPTSWDWGEVNLFAALAPVLLVSAKQLLERAIRKSFMAAVTQQDPFSRAAWSACGTPFRRAKRVLACAGRRDCGMRRCFRTVGSRDGDVAPRSLS
jgi:hypothetical protein